MCHVMLNGERTVVVEVMCAALRKTTAALLQLFVAMEIVVNREEFAVQIVWAVLAAKLAKHAAPKVV